MRAAIVGRFKCEMKDTAIEDASRSLASTRTKTFRDLNTVIKLGGGKQQCTAVVGYSATRCYSAVRLCAWPHSAAVDAH